MSSELDCKFELQNRKAVVILGNCLVHPAIGGLTPIQLRFLLPNTTSVTQPLDQGAICSLKAKYCSRLAQMITKAIDSLKDIPKVSVLDTMKLLIFSWENVTNNTTQSCFAKS